MNYALPSALTTAAFAGYLAVAIALHVIAGEEFAWHVAALLMVMMTMTYPTEAILSGRFVRREVTIAVTLSSVALIGLAFSPLLIIAAILAHGLLDLAKHRGVGVPFYPTYLFACAAFDFAYGGVLLVYLFTSGGL